MKIIMKKILALIITLVMALGMLTGCSDPVADELENFLNVQMVEVNANYDAIKTEAANWENLETEEAIFSSIKDVLIPKCDETLDMLSKIELETEEVKALKDKFTKVIELYKEGFSTLLAGFEAADEAMVTDGSAKLEEGVAVLDEYNAGLEALAAESGSTIEY